MANMLGPTTVTGVSLPNRQVTSLMNAESNRRFLALANDTGSTVWLGFKDSNPETTLSLRSATYRWTQIGATAEYFCELAAGGTPSLTEPNCMYINGAYAAKGTKGALAVGEWTWDTSGTGFTTVIVRITADADPDTTAAGYVTASYAKAYMVPLLNSQVWFEDVLAIHICGVWAYQESGAAVTLKTMKDY